MQFLSRATLLTTCYLLTIFGLTPHVEAHGNHAAQPPAAAATAQASQRRSRIQVADDADWTTKHMAEEHHITTFDSSSFFSLHDYDSNGYWTVSEMLKTYGLEHDSNVAINTPHERLALSTRLLTLLDKDNDGLVSLSEYLAFTSAPSSRTLPDLGTGPGHHWDMETEYEIHHWELYHDENTKLEDLTHPEDEEHFRLHDELEVEAEIVEAQDRLRIVEGNIPGKFRI